MSDIPADLRYSPDHLWVCPGTHGGLVRVGVTDFAQQSLGDVVQVTLPDLGETIKVGEACGDVESVKSVNDLVAPVAGTVRARNDDLAGMPELLNTDPYGRGWPERRDYASFADFADPDGNSWVLQEIGYRRF
jgi:glycine cleavage system H protein